MKLLKNILAISVLMTAFCHSAFAQGGGRGLDLFGPVREYVVAPYANIATAGQANVTNLPVWTRNLEGICVLDVAMCTNWGTNIEGFYVQSSADNTNWTFLTNFAYGNPFSQVYSNFMYANGTNLSATNLYATNFGLLQGTVTTPNIATAGFGTPYILPSGLQLFTNGCSSGTGAITNGNASYEQSNVTTIAWDMRATPGYIRVYVTNAGTNLFGATLRAYPVNPYLP
jgi:hypothetical protein